MLKTADGCKPACDMRGYLSFLILWLVNAKPMSGAEMGGLSWIEKKNKA